MLTLIRLLGFVPDPPRHIGPRVFIRCKRHGGDGTGEWCETCWREEAAQRHREAK